MKCIFKGKISKSERDKFNKAINDPDIHAHYTSMIGRLSAGFDINLVGLIMILRSPKGLRIFHQYGNKIELLRHRHKSSPNQRHGK